MSEKINIVHVIHINDEVPGEAVDVPAVPGHHHSLYLAALCGWYLLFMVLRGLVTGIWGELGFAAAISCILGKRKIVVVLLLHLYFQELCCVFLGC